MTENNKPVNRPKLIVILGPTASGKSDLGIKLAKKFNGEIISADSRQVYKNMDIGTGKVPKDVFQNAHDRVYVAKGVKHYLIDVALPKKQFTASDFKNLGEKAVKEILNKNKIPFVVGGTGFYIDALVKGSAFPEVVANKNLRAKLEKRTAESLDKELKKLDPKRAKTIDPKNKRRLIRALEIIKITGKPVPALKESPQYKALYLGINPPKNLLEKRIKLRLEKRLKQGMVKEVKNLLKSGVSHKRLHDFGLEYRWISEYLQGKITKEMLKTELLTSITKYSKRQMTWFKRNKEIYWVRNQKEAEKVIRGFFRFPRGV